jgi:hypothetical protein
MADEATLLVRVKALLDDSFLMKGIKNVVNKTGNIKGAAGVPKEGGAGMLSNVITNIGSGIKNMVNNIKGVLKATLIIGTIAAAFGPVMNLLDSISKALMIFLRPITDVVTILLMPILSMLRPLIKTFSAMMMPFKKAAMQGSAAAQMLISQGMTQVTEGNTEVGGEMISAGWKGALSSASLLMKGFMDILLTPLTGIEFMGIGDVISGAMDSWESAAIAGIYKVQAKADLIKGIGDNIESIPINTLQTSFTTIDTFVEEMKEKVNGFKIAEFKDNWDIIQDKSNTIFSPLVSLLSDESTLSTYIKDTTKIMEDMALEFPNTANVISTSIQTVMKDWKESIEKMSGNEQLDLMNAGASSLISELKQVEKTSGWQKVGDITKDILNNMIQVGTLGLAPGKIRKFEDRKATWINDVNAERTKIVDEYLKMFPEVSQGQKAGLTEMLSDMNLYYGNSLIPDSQLAGLQHMLLQTQQYYGTNGLIPTTLTTGYATTSESTQKFLSAMNNYSDAMNNLVSKAIDNAKRLASEARSYASARESYESKLRSFVSSRRSN